MISPLKSFFLLRKTELTGRLLFHNVYSEAIKICRPLLLSERQLNFYFAILTSEAKNLVLFMHEISELSNNVRLSINSY